MTDRVAVVTGAGNGMGEAIGVALAGAGHPVALVDIDGEAVRGTGARIRALGGVAAAWTFDLQDVQRFAPLLDEIEQGLGTIGVLVNAAGALGYEHVADTTVDAWDLIVRVNARAPYFLVQEVGRRLIEARVPGRIVNISSTSAHRAGASGVAYSCSKAAIEALTRGAAAWLGPYGTTVNTVVPGPTDTQMFRSIFGHDDEAIRRSVTEGELANLVHRIGQPGDVADVVAFLCSDASRHMTAQTVHVSGGKSF